MSIYFLYMQREPKILSNVIVLNFSEDVFLVHTRDHKNPVIFGLFNTTRWEICVVNNILWNKICLPLPCVSWKYCWPALFLIFYISQVTNFSSLSYVYNRSFIFKATISIWISVCFCLKYPGIHLRSVSWLFPSLSDPQQNGSFCHIVYKISVPC